MLVRDFMISNVPTCSPMVPLGVAARMMVDAEAPVIAVVPSSGAFPVGLLSCANITNRLVALFRNPLEFCAAEAMSLSGITLRPTALLEEAASDMSRANQDWALVVDDQGSVMGALARDTALTALRGFASSEPLGEHGSLRHLIRSTPMSYSDLAVH